MSDMIALAYGWLNRVAAYLQSPFLLCVRLYWGWQFYETGAGKLHNIAHVTQFFASLGIPAPAANAWFVACLETAGGILLIFGLASRAIAIPLVIDMVVAYLTADRDALRSLFSAPEKFYGADPFTFLMASLIVLSFGPGVFSVDHLIARFRARKEQVRAKSMAG